MAGANVRERGWRERTSESEGSGSSTGSETARVAGASYASEGGGGERQRARVAGANVRERGLSSCVIVIGSLSTILYTFSGEQPTHYAQPTD